METTARPPSPFAGNSGPLNSSVAVHAKGALRRLVLAKLEPTPDNYAKAYYEEAGLPQRAVLPSPLLALLERLVGDVLEEAGASARQRLLQHVLRSEWGEATRQFDELRPRCREARAVAGAAVIEQVAAGVGRAANRETADIRLGEVQQVLAMANPDVGRMQNSLRQLSSSWARESASGNSEDAPEVHLVDSAALDAAATGPVPATPPSSNEGAWQKLLASLLSEVGHALPPTDSHAAELAREVADAAVRLQTAEPTEGVLEEVRALADRTRKVHQHRQYLLESLTKLCHELTAGMADLSEDASWAKGQCDAMRAKLEEGLSGRGVRAVSNMLKATRSRQLELREERESARGALRSMVSNMLKELNSLGAQTGQFHDNVGRYADAIEQADSLEGLAQVVKDLAGESRDAQALIGQTQERLNAEHDNATRLSERVSQLESELRRLSEEVSTDQLTQIANRRGLFQAFTAEKARAERSGKPLAIGLIDIDDFKRLNDTLGHGAGDDALKALAAKMRDGLRPTDTVARYGGEEFVVMLPETDVDTAVVVLTRLQRGLTRGLFMHDQQQVFVTFSAGVSCYRQGEPLEDALDRADEALYEAKRTGKNRTCIS